MEKNYRLLIASLNTWHRTRFIIEKVSRKEILSHTPAALLIKMDLIILSWKYAILQCKKGNFKYGKKVKREGSVEVMFNFTIWFFS